MKDQNNEFTDEIINSETMGSTSQERSLGTTYSSYPNRGRTNRRGYRNYSGNSYNSNNQYGLRTQSTRTPQQTRTDKQQNQASAVRNKIKPNDYKVPQSWDNDNGQNSQYLPDWTPKEDHVDLSSDIPKPTVDGFDESDLGLEGFDIDESNYDDVV